MMKKLVTSLLAALAIAAPAQAGTVEADQLLGMIESTGTTISFNSNKFDPDCAAGKAGYYVFEAKVQDLFVVCKENINVKDGDELWETVSHEATHVMQACNGGLVFEESYLPRTFRELDRKAPHYSKLINDQYTGAAATHEAEAFWMELQPPADVLAYFEQACLKEKKS
ncbi:MAG: hypothetical protein ACKO0M_13020 [Cyanobium sp.]